MVYLSPAAFSYGIPLVSISLVFPCMSSIIAFLSSSVRSCLSKQASRSDFITCIIPKIGPSVPLVAATGKVIVALAVSRSSRMFSIVLIRLCLLSVPVSLTVP